MANRPSPSLRFKLTDIKDITTVHINSLRKLKINSPHRLAHICYNPASRKVISDLSGIPTATLLRYVHFADLLRLPRCGPVWASYLTDVGFKTMAQIAANRPVVIWSRLMRTCSTQPIIPPSLITVNGWVQAAQGLPKVVVY